ncbi:MAG: choline/glycine/proline betaine transport protein [Marinobacter psychrophilus]|jgi:choline/glycine/proline betaine transport protein
MFIELFGNGGVVAAANADTTMALFNTIELMNTNSWVVTVMAGICTFMLVTYFVTSADSATLVVCTLISMGDSEPLARYRVFWSVAIGAVASTLLLTGGLAALQTATIVAALSFSFILIMAIYGLFKSLLEEPIPGQRLKAAVLASDAELLTRRPKVAVATVSL